MDNPRPQGHAVVIEFDGVLNDLGAWRGEDDLGLPREGAQALVAALREHGWEVVIVTHREPARVRGWLATHGFAERHAQREHPPATVTLSARALRFDGHFQGLLARLLSFKPHWE